MPEYTVIAGPNGAGKSTFSALLAHPGTLIFDPDKERAKIERNYPDISDEAVESELTRVYDTFELKALGIHQDLTVETNLRNTFLAERATHFKKQGYQTNLIFLLLKDIDHSFKRVNMRVAQKGHFVDQESIRYNYKESLLNLYKVADQFDNLLLMDVSIKEDQSPPLLLATFKDKSLNYQNEEMPGWTIRPFSNIKLALNSANKKDLPPDIQR